jgi:hypothetical protein
MRSTSRPSTLRGQGASETRPPIRTTERACGEGTAT